MTIRHPEIKVVTKIEKIHPYFNFLGSENGNKNLL